MEEDLGLWELVSFLQLSEQEVVIVWMRVVLVDRAERRLEIWGPVEMDGHSGQGIEASFWMSTLDE